MIIGLKYIKSSQFVKFYKPVANLDLQNIQWNIYLSDGKLTS